MIHYRRGLADGLSRWGIFSRRTNSFHSFLTSISCSFFFSSFPHLSDQETTFFIGLELYTHTRYISITPFGHTPPLELHNTTQHNNTTQQHNNQESHSLSNHTQKFVWNQTKTNLPNHFKVRFGTAVALSISWWFKGTGCSDSLIYILSWLIYFYLCAHS